MNKIHFISGLPRSGSTLLAALLRQNPRFTGGMTSGLGGLVMAAQRTMGPDNEFSVQIGEERRKRVLTGLFESYYGGPDAAEVVFDTNRLWCAHMPLLKALYPQAKVVACVRNPAWIMDSIERLTRSNALEFSKIFSNAQERGTVYARADALASRDRLIGYPWSALKEAYYGDEAERLLLVEYDILCQRPKETLGLIYQFLGEPAFEHDFDNVDYQAEDFDQQLATRGLHTVKRKVEWKPRRTILPPDIFERFAALSFWAEFAGTKAHRIVQQGSAAEGNGGQPGKRAAAAQPQGGGTIN